MRVTWTVRGGWKTSSRFALGLPLLALGASMALAQGGPELAVNTYTTGGQSFPSACADATGAVVVVWEGGNPFPCDAGQDGSCFGVFGQRFDAAGAKRGGEFAVNTYTNDYQSFPAAACVGDGRFVVVWSSFLQDGNSDGIFGQRFAATGAPAGSEFQVNTHTTGPQSYPQIATDADGDFIVVWSSTGQDGDDDGIYAQRYSSSGAPLGSEFQVNTYTTGSQTYPAVASDGSGGFLVIWESAVQDGSGLGVFGRRFANTGMPVGTEFQVNTTTSGTQAHPSIDADGIGRFVVAWGSEGQDGDGFAIVSRRFGADGAPIGGEVTLNTYSTGDQDMPDVAAELSGDFVVAWTSYGQDGADGGVFARRFTSTGNPGGPELAVNVHTAALQYSPSLALTRGSDFIATWASEQAGGDFFEIVGRWFIDPTVTATPSVTTTRTASPTSRPSAIPTATPTRTGTRPQTPSTVPTNPPPPTATVPPPATATGTPQPVPTASATGTETATPEPSATVAPRQGDCNRDGQVTIDEVLLAVSIDFGKAEIVECEAADKNGDDAITIEELVGSVQEIFRDA